MDPKILTELEAAGHVRVQRFSVKPTPEGYWAVDRDAPAARIPTAPLHEYLQWILEQLDYGQYDLVADEPGGKVESIVIGKEAANTGVTQEEVAGHCLKRGLAVRLCGAMADAREGGTVPEFKAQIDYHSYYVEYVGADNAQSNTDQYYARQLVESLRRIHDTTFSLSAVPIGGRVPDIAQRLLKQATRCYFFRLELGCIALCRANLESSLYSRVGESELAAETARNPKRGKLESLIGAAQRLGLLDSEHGRKAHLIRRSANDILHGDDRMKVDPVDVLRDTRAILEHLFPS